MDKIAQYGEQHDLHNKKAGRFFSKQGQLQPRFLLYL